MGNYVCRCCFNVYVDARNREEAEVLAEEHVREMYEYLDAEAYRAETNNVKCICIKTRVEGEEGGSGGPDG